MRRDLVGLLTLQEPDDLRAWHMPGKSHGPEQPSLVSQQPVHVQSACQHCDGIVYHERQCLTLNPIVHYACEIVVYPDKLTIGDAIILHSLGVRWSHLDG